MSMTPYMYRKVLTNYNLGVCHYPIERGMNLPKLASLF